MNGQHPQSVVEGEPCARVLSGPWRDSHHQTHRGQILPGAPAVSPNFNPTGPNVIVVKRYELLDDCSTKVCADKSRREDVIHLDNLQGRYTILAIGCDRTGVKR